MPSAAPVTFNITLAPLTANFEGTPQQLATAIVARLSISPSAPWSSFQNGGSAPNYDVGPVLSGGVKWLVFNSALSQYGPLTVDGAGILPGTVALSVLAPQAPLGIQIFDQNGNAQVLSNGNLGQVLSATATGPAFANPVTNSSFEVTVGSDQPYTTNGSDTQIAFDTVKFANGVTFDTVNNQITVPAGTAWMIYAYAQVEYNSVQLGQSVQSGINIRLNGTDTAGSGFAHYQPSGDATGNPLSRIFLGTSGVINVPGNAPGVIDVSVSTNDSVTPAAGGASVAANSTNTRFGGFQIQ